MVYKNIELVPYNLKMDTDLQNSQLIYSEKKGYILKLYIDKYCGCGEVSLLENYSKENLKQIMWAFEEIKIALSQGESYQKEDFLNIFEIYSVSLPSFNFALDIALYDILSQQQNISLAKFVHSKALNHIKICGIYLKNNLVENNVIKVKLLCQNVDYDIKMVLDLIDKYDKNILLRLDANKGYNIDDAIRICNSVSVKNIQYIEEPLKKMTLSNLEKLKDNTKIKIAIDESVYTDDYKSYIKSGLLDYIVIKPSIFGSIKKLLDFQQYAVIHNINIVISSSLENYIGNLATIHIASALRIENTEHGINNLFYYNYSDKVFYNKRDKEINIKNIIGLGACFNDK